MEDVPDTARRQASGEVRDQGRKWAGATDAGAGRQIERETSRAGGRGRTGVGWGVGCRAAGDGWYGNGREHARLGQAHREERRGEGDDGAADGAARARDGRARA